MLFCWHPSYIKTSQVPVSFWDWCSWHSLVYLLSVHSCAVWATVKSCLLHSSKHPVTYSHITVAVIASDAPAPSACDLSLVAKSSLPITICLSCWHCSPEVACLCPKLAPLVSWVQSGPIHMEKTHSRPSEIQRVGKGLVKLWFVCKFFIFQVLNRVCSPRPTSVQSLFCF